MCFIRFLNFVHRPPLLCGCSIPPRVPHKTPQALCTLLGSHSCCQKQTYHISEQRLPPFSLLDAERRVWRGLLGGVVGLLFRVIQLHSNPQWTCLTQQTTYFFIMLTKSLLNFFLFAFASFCVFVSVLENFPHYGPKLRNWDASWNPRTK